MTVPRHTRIDDVAGPSRSRIDPALEAFVAAEHPRVVGLLVLYTNDRGVAEELAQDAIVRLCQHWPRVSGMDNRRAWMSRVAINLANSWFRRRAVERRANRRHGLPVTVADTEDVAATMAVREAVVALPPRQRMVVALRFYSGLSVAETAVAMRCAEGTVKSLTHKATTALRAVDDLGIHQEATHGV